MPKQQPAPVYRPKGFTLSESMITELKQVAAIRGWNTSIIAREALSQWLDRYRESGKLSQ